MPASEDSQDQPTMTAESDAEEQHQEQEDYKKLLDLYDESMRNLTEGEIVPGRVIGVTSNSVIVDVGYKSEGLIPIEEFTDREGRLTVAVGEEVDVLLEKTEDLEGHVLLSRIKAQRMRRWTEVERAYKEGRVIKGRITDRIKGGLTVDVGLRAFLPGSLVDIKPVKNLESLRGQEMEFKVISLDRLEENVDRVAHVDLVAVLPVVERDDALRLVAHVDDHRVRGHPDDSARDDLPLGEVAHALVIQIEELLVVLLLLVLLLPVGLSRHGGLVLAFFTGRHKKTYLLGHGILTLGLESPSAALRLPGNRPAAA